jgi:DNA-binding MarR family transcriptional regulator
MAHGDPLATTRPRSDPPPVAGVVDIETVDLIDAALVRLVRRITDRRTTELVNTWAGVDIERSGFTLLARLEENAEARLAELAAAADIDVSTASRQMARLLEQCLVARSTDPSNHRALRHQLTDQGAAALSRLRRARRRWIADSVDDFSSSEQALLADLLTRFSDNLQDQSEHHGRTEPTASHPA